MHFVLAMGSDNVLFCFVILTLSLAYFAHKFLAFALFVLKF